MGHQFTFPAPLEQEMRRGRSGEVSVVNIMNIITIIVITITNMIIMSKCSPGDGAGDAEREEEV